MPLIILVATVSWRFFFLISDKCSRRLRHLAGADELSFPAPKVSAKRASSSTEAAQAAVVVRLLVVAAVVGVVVVVKWWARMRVWMREGRRRAAP